MSISDRLDKIEARANAATDGPWESDRHVRGDGHVVIGGGLRRAHLPGDVPGHAENAEFIAHARADVPWLIEQVRKRDAALRAVLDACSTYEKTQAIYRIEMGQREIIRVVRAEISAALGEES